MKFKENDAAQNPSKNWKRILGRIGILFLIFLFCLLVLFIGAMWMLCKGPSIGARDIFVTTCMETSFAKLFPPLFLSETEIDRILAENTILENNEVTDTYYNFSEPAGKTDSEETAGIQVVEVTGGTYKGKMMIIQDPSRVCLATSAPFGEDASGEKLITMIEKFNAVGGINAGGFSDENGVGNGGVPLGLVIQNGQLLHDGGGVVVGFDRQNVLHVGRMTSAEAQAKGIRDAVSFGPVLIVNGKPSQFAGYGGGLNPRTAIGQREDGAVLLLAIDGRQPHSLGASYKDLVEIMQEYGAVNAANLDGGSSTMMYYNGELINSCASLYGPRLIPTAFVVKGEG